MLRARPDQARCQSRNRVRAHFQVYSRAALTLINEKFRCPLRNLRSCLPHVATNLAITSAPEELSWSLDEAFGQEGIPFDRLVALVAIRDARKSSIEPHGADTPAV